MSKIEDLAEEFIDIMKKGTLMIAVMEGSDNLDHPDLERAMSVLALIDEELERK